MSKPRKKKKTIHPQFQKRLRDAAKWMAGQEKGNRKGHASQISKADERAEGIRRKWAEMEAAGESPTNAAVAAALNCSLSTVIRAFRRGR